MIKIITTMLFIATTLAYPYDEENKNGPPVDNPVLPYTKPVKLESSPHPAVPEDVVKDGKPEGSDLKTDATFWPWITYRSYYSYPHYRYAYPTYYSSYRYYRPRVYSYYSDYYW